MRQQSKKGSSKGKVERVVGKVGDLGIIVVSSEPPDIGVKVGGGGAVPGASNASDDEVLDALQHTLDIVGLVPGFGEPADFFSAVISFGRGDYTGVALSLAAMIPIVGILATYAKFASRLSRLGARRIIAGTEGLVHSFDSHAAQWFGRSVGARTHMEQWQALIERAAASEKQVPWSTRGAPTVGHLARIDGKYFFVQFFLEGRRAGELATAFVPNQSQLSAILKLLK